MRVPAYVSQHKPVKVAKDNIETQLFQAPLTGKFREQTGRLAFPCQNYRIVKTELHRRNSISRNFPNICPETPHFFCGEELKRILRPEDILRFAVDLSTCAEEGQGDRRSVVPPAINNHVVQRLSN